MLPPSVFMVLIVVTLMAAFVAAPLLRLIRQVFTHHRRHLSTGLGLIFYFNEPRSKHDLLSVFFLLFKGGVGTTRIITTRFAINASLGPLGTRRCTQSDFSLISRGTSRLKLDIRGHCQMASGLMRSVVQLTQGRHPSVFLLKTNDGCEPSATKDGKIL